VGSDRSLCVGTTVVAVLSTAQPSGGAVDGVGEFSLRNLSAVLSFLFPAAALEYVGDLDEPFYSDTISVPQKKEKTFLRCIFLLA
jgi:hypothetical protein